MTELVTHTAARHQPWTEIPRVEVAAYAMVRLSALGWPAPSAAAADFKRSWRALAAQEQHLAELTGPLTAALHDTAATHSGEFHRRLVLPLRRDVHNGRSPRSQLRARLGDLPADVPLLGRWLAALDERDRLNTEVAQRAVAALASDRVALASVCAAEPLRRAVALSSEDLLRGVDRAAALGPEPDSRARKAEAGVLRYALRATSKTSPLSWFTYVGWGSWGADDPGDDLRAMVPEATSEAHRALVTSLVRAVLAAPHIRPVVAHRLAPAVVIADGRVCYRRDTISGVRRFVISREEQVALPLTAPLAFILKRLTDAGSTGVRPAHLAEALSARLAGGGSRHTSISGYVDRLVTEQLLVPVEPVDPQRDDVLSAFAGWLDDCGQPELADQLCEIDDHSRTLADLPAGARPAALRRLDGFWRRTFTTLGVPPVDAPAIREDVTARNRLTLGVRHGEQARHDLTRLVPLTELFDVSAVLRSVVHQEMLDRYGPGGRCRVAELLTDGTSLWASVGRIGADGSVRPADGAAQALPARVRELANLRREVTETVRATIRDGEVELSDQVLADTAAALPAWLLRRPASYSYFVQPFTDNGRTSWCLNHIYGGWGRFTSRFLSRLDQGAAAAVAAQLRRTLGGGRVAQYRPVMGFNANVHPLLVADEVGEDPAWATLLIDELELVHDPVTDQVRLRIARTGAPVDILYLGFLVPFVLPDRVAPIYSDLGVGRSSLLHLAPRTVIQVAGQPVTERVRLRYRDLVLARRAWLLDGPTVRDWCGEMERDEDVPAASAARWAARLGLPDDVFVAGADAERMVDVAEFLRYLDQPKPQYVDLGSALHLRSLPRLLARHSNGVRIEEALPVPGDGPAGRRAVEFVVETYRESR